MKMSVITVVYNAVNTVERTIKSVLSQNYEDLEYVIIDGGSTDGTLEIIDRYKDRLGYFVSEPDNGIYDAMNKGIRACTGDVISILNSDDWYEAGALEKIASEFEQNDAEVIFGDVNEWYETGAKRYPFMGYDSIWHSFVHHPGMFVRSDVYKKFGLYNLEYSICSDGEFVLRTYSQGVKYLHLDSLVVNYSIGGSSQKKILQWAAEANNVAMKYLAKATNKTMVIDICNRRFNGAIDFYFKQQTKGFVQIYGKYIIIFGAGAYGKRAKEIMNTLGIQVLFYVDSSKEKWGNTFNGCSIASPEVLSCYQGSVLIASKNFESEIESDIMRLDNKNLKIVKFSQMFDSTGELLARK